MRTFAISLWALAFLVAGVVRAQFTQRVNFTWDRHQANADSGGLQFSTVSGDGRYVAFRSDATNLVPGDTNGKADVFVRDRQLGTTERVSVDSAGVQGDGTSSISFITPDGRYVAFASRATNLVPGDTNGVWDIFVRDRQNGTTTRVSVDSTGAESNGDSDNPWISADGRFVAFQSGATNLVPGDVNGASDIFVRDLQTGSTGLVSVDSSGLQANSGSSNCAISDDGRIVTFDSFATNLVPGDVDNTPDVFAHDRQTGLTEEISVDSNGVPGNDYSTVPWISSDGRFIVFTSEATNLVAGDTNGKQDVYIRDRQTGTTELASISSGGAQGNGHSFLPAVSADGRFVAFVTDATNLVPNDPSSQWEDLCIRDRQLGTTEWVGVGWNGAPAAGNLGGPTISQNGRFVVFSSDASNLVRSDTNGDWDIFLRDRLGGPDFTSLCEPGVGGVAPCPCSNAPGGPGRGCENSAVTGGAVLAAAGGSFLSSDSLSFTTSGEKPTATSVVLQGTTPIAAGAVYGQGLRCLGGTLKRLYTKSASGGSITAPIGNDSSVAVRSALLGSVIHPGDSRWYLVFYRDPIVLGGCPATSTFNCTQTGRIVWSP